MLRAVEKGEREEGGHLLSRDIVRLHQNATRVLNGVEFNHHSAAFLVIELKVLCVLLRAGQPGVRTEQRDAHQHDALSLIEVNRSFFFAGDRTSMCADRKKRRRIPA